MVHGSCARLHRRAADGLVDDGSQVSRAAQAEHAARANGAGACREARHHHRLCCLQQEGSLPTSMTASVTRHEALNTLVLLARVRRAWSVVTLGLRPVSSAEPVTSELRTSTFSAWPASALLLPACAPRCCH